MIDTIHVIGHLKPPEQSRKNKKTVIEFEYTLSPNAMERKWKQQIKILLSPGRIMYNKRVNDSWSDPSDINHTGRCAQCGNGTKLKARPKEIFRINTGRPSWFL